MGPLLPPFTIEAGRKRLAKSALARQIGQICPDDHATGRFIAHTATFSAAVAAVGVSQFHASRAVCFRTI
jgi:hypothetical protein